ncbi:MAG: glycoside hydrolase family 3 protein [Rhodothermales bacterium]
MTSFPTSLREKAAQLVFARIGSNMPPPVTVEEDAARVEALLERCPLGGLVLFNGRGPETARVLARLQARNPYPVLIGTDMERGVGQQVRGATVFPHAMAYAALGAEAEAAVEASARGAAREALACGIQLAFCPVADVNRDRRNPIIATRAFGTEPESVARLVRAYLRGCRAEGLLTSAKHFPGHGGTHQDSHEALPIVTDTRDVLEHTDLVPFCAAIEANVDAVMTAHVAFPAFDPSRQPATASPIILNGLLREALGFHGPVITDSLLMGAIRAAPGEEGVQAATLVRAGVDIVLDTPDPEAAVEGLVRAVKTGRLSADRLNEACARVWQLKQRLIDRFGRSIFTDPSRHVSPEEVGDAAHDAMAKEVSRRAVSVRDTAGVLPLSPDRVASEGLLGLLIKPHRSRLDPPEEPLGSLLRGTFPGAMYHEIGPEADEAIVRRVLEKAGQVRHVVVAMIVKPAAWHHFGLLPAQHAFVETLVVRRSVVLASLGSPYVLEGFPEASAHICTFSDVASSQQALVSVLVEGSEGNNDTHLSRC